jgi:single-stranded DNA-binding protein
MGQSFDVRRDTEKGRSLMVEGELRYREFNDKKHKKVKVRLAEIHLGKIGELDRAEKRDANAATPELPTNGAVQSRC